MKTEGPPLQRLTHRLSECPPDFLASPFLRWSGVVHVDAVVFDVLNRIGDGKVAPTIRDVVFYNQVLDSQKNLLSIVLIASWLLSDEYFRDDAKYFAAARDWLRGGLIEVSNVVEAEEFVRDADRREELARECLRAMNLRPQGETMEQAQDRLTTLNSVERQRVLQATQAAQKRADDIREAMRQKAAEESAAKYTRE
jgi:hypothetical protein